MSDKSTVVVLGNGYISSKLKKYKKNNSLYEYIFIENKNTPYTLKAGADLIQIKFNPVAVINTYGYTGKPNVDSCELNSEECFKRNVIDTYEILSNFKCPVINISSGCIYNDETGTTSYKETDVHNFGVNNPFASVYSQSKSLLENLFVEKEMKNKHYNLRIRMPFDDDLKDPKNYIGKILKYDKLVNYKNSITHLRDLSRVVDRILERIIIGMYEIPTGIYNIVNTGGITAQEILEISQEQGIRKSINKFYTTDDLLSSGDMITRRSNCVLDNSKARDLICELPSSKEAIKEAIIKGITKEFTK